MQGLVKLICINNITTYKISIDLFLVLALSKSKSNQIRFISGNMVHKKTNRISEYKKKTDGQTDTRT